MCDYFLAGVSEFLESLQSFKYQIPSLCFNRPILSSNKGICPGHNPGITPTHLIVRRYQLGLATAELKNAFLH